MNEIDPQSKASELVKTADKLLATQSGLDKLDLREKFVSEWEKLSCDERRTVGKEIEKLSAPREASPESTKIRASFNYQNGEITSLDFSRLFEVKHQNSSMIRLRRESESFAKPLDNCQKK